jgi:hypothetical protein
MESESSLPYSQISATGPYKYIHKYMHIHTEREDNRWG